MPGAVKNMYDSLKDFYSQKVDEFILAMLKKQWTQEELYERGL